MEEGLDYGKIAAILGPTLATIITIAWKVIPILVEASQSVRAAVDSQLAKNHATMLQQQAELMHSNQFLESGGASSKQVAKHSELIEDHAKVVDDHETMMIQKKMGSML